MQPGIPILYVCCVSLLVLAACEEGGFSEGDSSRPAAAKTIGPEGGIIKVGDPASLISNTEILIPAGALDKATEITIAPVAVPGNLPAYSLPASEAAVEFGPQGLSFLKPVTVTLGYSDANNDGLIDTTGFSEEEVAVLYTSGNQGDRRIYHPLARDPDRNTVTFQTTHFSTYLAYVGDPAAENDSGSGPGTTAFLPGEHFLAAPTYTYGELHDAPIPFFGNDPQYYITVMRPNTLMAWVDSKLNLSGPGIPCSFDPGEGTPYGSCTFEAAAQFPMGGAAGLTALFPKVHASGDTALWTWQCDFVAEHTILKNYAVVDETIAADNGAPGIYCEMEAVAGEPLSVRVTWGINANEEIYYANYHRLGIRFRAHYNGPLPD